MARKSKGKKDRQRDDTSLSEKGSPGRSSLAGPRLSSLLSSLHIPLIVVLILAAYANTFESDFHFDDEPVIVSNPIIKDLHYFAEPSSAKDFRGHFEYNAFIRRYIGYLTFALNYRFHGLDVTGYHIVNLLVHVGTSVLLYFFILFTFRTPFLVNSSVKDFEKQIALFAALLFACHPLQTQAVTYIWQRVSSLSTMLYLLSLVVYIKWRLSQTVERVAKSMNIREKYIRSTLGPPMLYLISLASAIFAMKTKETAFMLPVMLVLYELIFFKGTMRRRFIYLIPFLLTMLIIPLTLISIESPIEDLMGDSDETMKGPARLPRGEYLLSEFRVIVTYLRLIFLPVRQNLDYDYSRYYSFFNIEILSSFILLAFIFYLSVYFLIRYRHSISHVRLISFGVIWFFVNLILESSVIPLDNVIFEHRMYLPSIGIFTSLTVAVFVVCARRRAYTEVITVFLTVTVIVLTGATYARNNVWKDRLSLWGDVVKKSPMKARGHNNLGNGYRFEGLVDRAIEEYRTAIELDPNYEKAYNNLGVALTSKGLYKEATEHLQIAIDINPNFAAAYNNLGVAYRSRGLFEESIEHFKTALRLKPAYPEVLTNLAVSYIKQSRMQEALHSLEEAIRLDAKQADAYSNLSTVYRKLGRYDEAIEVAEEALRIRPDFAAPHNNLGLAYVEMRQVNKAMEAFKKAITIDDTYAEAYSNLGALYLSLGRYGEAIEELRTSVNIDPTHINARFNLGIAYLLTGSQEEAMDEYRALRKLSPKQADTLLSLLNSNRI